ncbi:MAG: hypothetical protein O2895_00405 [Chloroflexi bacterium]|nr:hypothetical protein [Chloroflexota bacterium]
MAIDATQRKAMAAGMTLTAKYKKAEHTAEVVAGEDGKLVYRLADGREFKSPSAAGSAVMGGVACNGWRFWSLATDIAEAPTKPAAKKAGAKRAPKHTATAEAQAEPTPDSDEA